MKQVEMKSLQSIGFGPAGKPERVCTLINAIFYFVGNVFISEEKGSYRLVAHHNGRILIDQSYPTLRGAKIAFSKLFGCRSWRKNVKAEWSRFYSADDRWLDVKMGENERDH
jgi:hypothetical protein